MKKDLDIQTCKFVPITSIVPKEWTGWFYTAISENAPFSWGDNNRTMVDAQSFANHIDEVLSYQDDEETLSEIEKYQDAVYDTLNYLGAKNIYIDLEN
jgi:hypothetical protein